MSGNLSARALFQEAMGQGMGQGRRNAEKCQAFQRSRRAGECFDSKEVVCDLGKLWPFGMEGAEVALDTDQERAELEEMGEWET